MNKHNLFEEYFAPIDKPREECGVFGVWGPHLDISKSIYFGLFALQHRGQESAGMTISVGNALTEFRGMGLVSQVFDDQVLKILRGRSGIGHVRYSTTGSPIAMNAQPVFIEHKGYQIGLGHNGNLVNTRGLREELLNEGVEFETSSDSEVMARLIMKYYSKGDQIETALRKALPQCKGAFTVIMITPDKIIGFRDSHGIRPLCLGINENDGKVSHYLASESAALDIVGATLVREVKPGEMVVISQDGVATSFWIDECNRKDRLCMFEFIYFARPDSYLLGQLLHLCRQRMGQNLAREVKFEADIVIPVPDSGTPHAIGLAKETGIPFTEGLIKNRYVGRTFINPNQKMRKTGVKMKLNPLKEVIKGKRVILVDDSIVRGTTSKQIVELIRDAGATEVHLAIASPPVKFPCFYGVDMASQEELIASHIPIKKLSELLYADSLSYLSVDGLIDATGLDREHFCLACLNDHYPIPIKHQMKLPKFQLE